MVRYKECGADCKSCMSEADFIMPVYKEMDADNCSKIIGAEILQERKWEIMFAELGLVHIGGNKMNITEYFRLDKRMIY